MSFFGATDTPVLDFWWRLSSGFQSQSGFCLIRIVEANVMYIPRDPPLVLHVPTSWWLARHQSCPHILLQRWGCRDSNSCSQNICESDALPTELNRDQQKKHYILKDREDGEGWAVINARYFRVSNIALKNQWKNYPWQFGVTPKYRVRILRQLKTCRGGE